MDLVKTGHDNSSRVFFFSFLGLGLKERCTAQQIAQPDWTHGSEHAKNGL